MSGFLNRLVPIIAFIVAVAVFLIGIVLLSYLFMFIVLIWLIFYVISVIRAKFGKPRGPRPQQSTHHSSNHSANPEEEAKPKSGRIIDVDDWKKL